MYIYIQTEKGLWTAGHYDPKGKFIPESDHDNEQDARQRVHYLNGGSPKCICKNMCEENA